MPFKKIRDDFWRVFIHVSYKETFEKAYKYAKKKGLELSFDEFKDYYETSAGFVIWCDEQNVMIVLCSDSSIESAQAGIITHECFHAVSAILRKRGIKLTEESEEVYAYYLEWLFKRIFYFCQQVDSN